jgi:hypothetical protein
MDGYAPETYIDKGQPEPSLEVMQRADIYSFGVVLWEILRGEYPNWHESCRFFKSMTYWDMKSTSN